MRITLAPLGLALLLATAPVRAGEGPDILQIFDAFVLSSAAASKCGRPDEATLQKFLANFELVWMRAAAALEARYPDRTQEQIGRAMKAKADHLSNKVFEVVAADGCGDAKIRDLLERFKAHVLWEPGRVS